MGLCLSWRGTRRKPGGSLERLIPVLILVLAAVAGAEVIDRVAVTVDRQVITDSAIREHIRFGAFLQQRAPSFTPEDRRNAADELVDRLLLYREMEGNKGKPMSESELSTAIQKIRQRYFAEPGEFAKQLAASGLTEPYVNRILTRMAEVERFSLARFGAAASEEEIEKFYFEHFVSDWIKNKRGSVPDIDVARDYIESVLTLEAMEKAVDTWLLETRSQARIQFFEEAFR